MSPDDWVLLLQRMIDRTVRRLRLGRAPERDRQRRLLIVQIDGLPGSVLERALAEGRMPFLAHLMARHGYHLQPMSVGMPTSTPAFQMAAMYGVRPDIPGFHYHDKRRRTDVYFPRAGDAARVEQEQARGRRGILEGGNAYGCVFTGGAESSLFNFATIKGPTGEGLLRAVSAFVVLAWVLVKGLVLTVLEIVRALLRGLADPIGESRRGWKWLALKVGMSVWVRHLFTLAVSRDLYAGTPAVYVNYIDYDVFAHAYGPRHRRALRILRGLDRSIHQLWRVIRRVPEYRYDLFVLSDHGQATTTPFEKLSGGRSLERCFFEEFLRPAGAQEVSPARPRVALPRPRSQGGPICLWRGKRHAIDNGPAGPFARRADWPLLVEGLHDLMAMPSAGDLVIYGNDSPDGNVSYVPEIGAHAGPSPDELYTFIMCPPGADPPSPITHPTQLYTHFIAYQET